MHLTYMGFIILVHYLCFLNIGATLVCSSTQEFYNSRGAMESQASIMKAFVVLMVLRDSLEMFHLCILFYLFLEYGFSHLVFSISPFHRDLIVIGYLIRPCCWDPGFLSALHYSFLALSAFFVATLFFILKGGC